MKKTNPKVAVLIPVYKEQPDAMEVASINQGIEIFQGIDIFLIYPVGMDLGHYQKISSGLQTVAFSPIFFADISGYNQLLLSKSLYRKFLNFTHIFIYQTDAWVFKNELTEWCNKGYDYYGAPLVSGINNGKIEYDLESGGNGGFSLRNVRKSLDTLNHRKVIKTPSECWAEIGKFHKWPGRILRIPVWLAMLVGYRNNLRWFIRNFGRNEDVFWSVHANKINPRFKAAPAAEELTFAWEKCAPELFEITHTLPMGCHAWKKRYPEFWNIHIKRAE